MGTASCFHCLACWEPELSVHLQVCAVGSLRLQAFPSCPQHLPTAPLLTLTSQLPWEECEADVDLVAPPAVPVPPRSTWWSPCWEGKVERLSSSFVLLQDAPQEQLKVPLRALPLGQVVRLVFPTSQVLVTKEGSQWHRQGWPRP